MWTQRESKNTHQMNRHLKRTYILYVHTLHFKSTASLISAHSWTNHTCALQIVIDFNSQVGQIARHPELLCPLPADWSSVLVWHASTQWDDCEAALMPGRHSGGSLSLPSSVQPERLMKPQSRAAKVYITSEWKDRCDNSAEAFHNKRDWGQKAPSWTIGWGC